MQAYTSPRTPAAKTVAHAAPAPAASAPARGEWAPYFSNGPVRARPEHRWAHALPVRAKELRDHA